MANGKFGFPTMARTATAGNNNQIPNFPETTFIVRVIDVILNENHPLYNGPNSIGSILGIKVKSTGEPLTSNIKATPALNGDVYIPLLNEYVRVSKINSPNSSAVQFMYEGPIAIYGITAPNAQILPSTLNSPPKEIPTVDYTQVTLGALNVEDNEIVELSTDVPSNPSQNTFIERSDIHPLRPFSGDKMYSGRFGNTLRFGSTAKVSDAAYQNPWSSAGTNGDPITILRNGQPKNVSSYGAEFIVEDIKNDLSSIYLTSYQKIPFSLANENFNSFLSKPILPSQFANPQVIFHSDRVVINSKTDGTLISGEKFVGISSNNSINLEAKQIYLEGNDIRLGNKNASQPALKGDDTVELLKRLLVEVTNLATALKYTQKPADPTQSVLDAAISSTAMIAEKNLNSINTQLDNLKSKFVKIF
jgi:hypothetical protein